MAGTEEQIIYLIYVVVLKEENQLLSKTFGKHGTSL